MAASSAFSTGRKSFVSFCSLLIIACTNEPLTALTRPSSDNSPDTKASVISACSCPDANKIPKAMGKSYDGPSFGRSAGARLTVILRAGKSAPVLRIAERTRSFASSTADVYKRQACSHS